jgi:predicted membrane protein
MMDNVLLAAFLILVAASAALVISIGALALFDVIFGKRKPAVVAAETDSTQLEPPTQRNSAAEAKLKPKAFVSVRRRRRAERATGYRSHSQRVRHHRG